MPQMSPFNWLILFLVFMMTLLMGFSKPYYFFNPEVNKTLALEESYNMTYNWSW